MKYSLFFSTLLGLFLAFNTSAAEPLELWRLSQYSAKPGDIVSITGKGFDSSTKVLLGNVSLNPQSVTPTSLTFQVSGVPGGATYGLKLTDTSVTTNSQDFYVEFTGPEFWRLSTYTAKPGEVVTVYGKNFNTYACILLSGYNSSNIATKYPITDPDGTQRFSSFTFTVPQDIKPDTTYAVQPAVCAAHGGGYIGSPQNMYVSSQNSSQNFELWKLSRYSAKPGDHITLTGRGFDNYNTTVVIAEKGVEHYGGTYLQIDKSNYTLKGSDEITITLPNYSDKLKPDTTYEVSLYWGGGKVGGTTLEQDLYVTGSSSRLELWQLSKYQAFPEEKIKVTGQGFTADTKAYLGDTKLSTDFTSSSELVVKVPADIAFGKSYTLKLKDGESTSEGQGVYIKDPRWEK
jgi:hypothetical protein